MPPETTAFLETAEKQSDAEATSLTTSSTIPANTGIDVTVRQDTTGDGAADNEETVTLNGGDETNDLTAFESSAGADYWLLVEMTSDGSDTPSFDTATTDQALTFNVTSNVYSLGATFDAVIGMARTARAYSGSIQTLVDTNPMFRDAESFVQTNEVTADGRTIIGRVLLDDAILLPQDEGTGLEADEADWMSAGHFAGMLGQKHNTDYVESGLDIDVDWDNLTYSIQPGLAYLEYPAQDIQVQGYQSDGQYNTTWTEGVSFTAAIKEQPEITFRADEQVEVWIVADPSEPNSIDILSQPEGSGDPDSPNLKIAQLDPAAEQVKQMNRGREVFPQVTSDPNDVSPGEVWYRTDLNEFRASIGAGGPIIAFDTTEV